MESLILNSALDDLKPRNEDMHKKSRKSAHNSRALISRLPTETLARIFLHVIAERTRHRPEQFMQLRTLLSCTQVCSYWRQVAIGDSTLWTHIMPQNQWTAKSEWIKLFLSRSKSSPLSIEADIQPYTPILDVAVENIKSALQHIHRTQVLTLCSSVDTFPLLLPSLETPAPLLESLSLRVYFGPKRYLELPEWLHNTIFPRLRRLSLTYCDLKWDSPIFSAKLTHLCIKCQSTAFRPTTSQFLGVLHNLSELQTLEIHDIVPNIPAIPQQITQLPRLSNLTLSGQLFDCAYLLAHLGFPTNVKLHLQCLIHGPEIDISTPLAIIRSKQNDAPDDTILHESALTVHAYPSHVGLFAGMFLLQDSSPDFSSILLRWDTSRTATDVQVSDITLRLWKTIHQSPITTFYIRGCDPTQIRSDAWKTILAQPEMCTTKRLVIGAGFNGISAALSAQYTTNEGTSASAPFCYLPALRELCMFGVNFSLHFPDSTKTFFEVVYDTLRSRSDAGYGVESVEIVDGISLSTRQLDLLKDVALSIRCRYLRRPERIFPLI